MNIYQVNSFTSQPFKGNPAGVCILDNYKNTSKSWMQNIAFEMNLSETAFIKKIKQNEYTLRWFTPIIETQLCGHATLATAHVLKMIEAIDTSKEVRFNTISGEIMADFEQEYIRLDFPRHYFKLSNLPYYIQNSLKVNPLLVVENASDILIEVSTETELRNIEPDFNFLKKECQKGIIVTTKSESSNYDFISRCFFPHEGINEDPVTGSAHCLLGPYWSKRLNKSSLYAYQASDRGGELKVVINEDRIIIIGQAVTIFSGELSV